MEPTTYGAVLPDRFDVRQQMCATIDLRIETGARLDTPDGSRVYPGGAHPFTLSVFGVVPDDPHALPVAEVLLMVEGVEVSLVGHLTGRPGVRELTPDHLAAARRDPIGYRAQLAGWLGIAA